MNTVNFLFKKKEEQNYKNAKKSRGYDQGKIYRKAYNICEIKFSLYPWFLAELQKPLQFSK